VVKELKHIAASVGRRGEVDDLQQHARPLTRGHTVDRGAPVCTLFTAGVCHQNPGPGGWAYVAVVQDQEHEECGDDLVTTDMRMELTAAIKGLETTAVGSSVVVYTSSQVVQQGMATWIHKWLQNNWRTSNGQVVDNQDLWQKLWTLSQERTVQWEWLGGHPAHGEARDAGDHRVHALAYAAMRRAAAQAAAEHGEASEPAVERPLPTDKHRPPAAEGGIPVSRSMSIEDQRLALMAECHALEQRWAELHDEVVRLDEEWQRLMEALASRVEARRKLGPPGWADGASTFFDLGQHAQQLSSVATEALQTCDRFAKALQRTSEGF
jgi:ribonuclease HI